jgi:hypothetical protein
MNSEKFILATTYLRRVRVVGRSFAVAQTHASEVAAAQKLGVTFQMGGLAVRDGRTRRSHAQPDRINFFLAFYSYA